MRNHRSNLRRSPPVIRPANLLFNRALFPVLNPPDILPLSLRHNRHRCRQCSLLHSQVAILLLNLVLLHQGCQALYRHRVPPLNRQVSRLEFPPCSLLLVPAVFHRDLQLLNHPSSPVVCQRHSRLLNPLHNRAHSPWQVRLANQVGNRQVRLLHSPSLNRPANQVRPRVLSRHTVLLLSHRHNPLASQVSSLPVSRALNRPVHPLHSHSHIRHRNHLDSHRPRPLRHRRLTSPAARFIPRHPPLYPRRTRPYPNCPPGR